MQTGTYSSLMYSEAPPTKDEAEPDISPVLNCKQVQCLSQVA